MPRRVKPASRRSEATKAAILAAARERFAADGYERATIRARAAPPPLDPAPGVRDYGHQEKLFAAAAEFDLRLPKRAARSRETIGVDLVEHFIDRWESDDTLMALLRAAVTNKVAAQRMRAIFAAQLVPTVATLSGDPSKAATRAGLIASQVLGMALCRYVLRLPPVVALTRSEVSRWLGPTIQRYLTGSM
jgi:hypothetical protein